MPTAWSQSSPSRVIHADNLEILPVLPDEAFTLIYLDPPFNTGRKQNRQSTTSVRSKAPADSEALGAHATGTFTGFKGRGGVPRPDGRRLLISTGSITGGRACRGSACFRWSSLSRPGLPRPETLEP